MTDALARHEQTVEGLAAGFRRGGIDCEVIETHISSVLLAGDTALKLKKPLDLGFLNFASLADREHYCREELRLNSRLAPSVYRDVVAITGTPSAPALDGPGEPFDFAVRMHRFDQAQLLSRHAEAGDLDGACFDRLATRVAVFHRRAATVPLDEPLGTPERIIGAMLDNFGHVREVLDAPVPRAQLDAVERWTRRQVARLEATMRSRRETGFVRECHGDMHLGNMVLVDGEIEVFDGIEFNDDFRWIDTQSEIAFLTMDLDRRGARALRWRFLNAYLAESGDYAGLALHRCYQAYRALVRAKVDAIRAGQAHVTPAERADALGKCGALVELAEAYTQAAPPRLFLTCGLSGSGKTTVARARATSDGLVHLRSDVERKRLHGLAALDRSASELDAGIYSADATARTYERLLALAAEVLAAGHGVIVDATFLTRGQRAPFLTLAAERGVEATILYCQATRAELERRLVARAGDASEADVTVLEAQLPRFEPPGEGEPVERV